MNGDLNPDLEPYKGFCIAQQSIESNRVVLTNVSDGVFVVSKMGNPVLLFAMSGPKSIAN